MLGLRNPFGKHKRRSRKSDAGSISSTTSTVHTTSAGPSSSATPSVSAALSTSIAPTTLIAPTASIAPRTLTSPTSSSTPTASTVSTISAAPTTSAPPTASTAPTAPFAPTPFTPLEAPSSETFPRAESVAAEVSQPISTETTQVPIMASTQAIGLNGFGTPPRSPQPFSFNKGIQSYFAGSRSVSGNFSSMNQVVRRGNNGYKIGFVQDTAISLKKKSMSELGAGVYQSVANVSFVHLLEWVRTERLTTLPHKGSRWDRVLIRALYFAEQLHNFDTAIQGFALDSNAAASLGYGHARLLLELGSANSEALDHAFAVFYKLALSFSSILHRSELLAATSDVREQLCLMYTDLLSLVVEVSIAFYRAVKGMTSTSVIIDIYQTFGDTIESFHSRQSKIVELIWNYQIENEGLDTDESLDLKTLSRFLAPQDRVLATLTRDHTVLAESQAEFTCMWFQKTLTKFINGNDRFFLITGQTGSGKSVLAGSIAERLQRPVGRKSYDTVFCSISSSIASQATPLALVKTILYQLLNLRVGNMAMYHALHRAYGRCRDAADRKAYEEALWQALSDILKQPLEDGNDLVIVVDGIDEFTGGETVSSSALQKLLSATIQGKRVRLITLSAASGIAPQNQGLHYAVTREDVHDDIYAVAMKALMRNSHFHRKSSPDQESALDRIVHAANGSFLWAILTCQILGHEKSSESFTKSLETLTSSQTPVQDLVHRLITLLDLSNNSKMLLSWLTSAERPLTIEEIRNLFSIDVPRAIITDVSVDVNATVDTLRPFLAVQDHIVRFRHPVIQSTIQTLASQNKIQVPIKDSHTDFMLRLLTYAKVTLREKREPVIDNTNLGLADRLFHQHRFLEYVVRYWVSHFKRTPFSPKQPAEYKPPAELQKVFPDTATLPLLEQLCWDTQLTTTEAVDLHVFTGSLRKAFFTENHPAVLQTYLASATCFSVLSNPTEAQYFYYVSTKISRTIYSDIHPLTLECASRFVKVTDGLTSTTRNEIMTRREEILITLITAYERQQGSTSDVVIRTRKLLAELYVSINEQERATEIYRLIQEATIQHYGKHSQEAQDLHHDLRVMLGPGKGDREVETYKESFFTSDEDDEQTLEVIDIHYVMEHLGRAEAHLSRGETALAEKIYVELWQLVSSKCRSVQTLEWHERHLDIATTYSRFLQSQKRSSEATAILVCVWQQYDQHQLAYSESMISRLTNVAKSLKTMEYYAVALSIFKFAHSYYKNVRKEESTRSSEVNEEISATSTELIKMSLTSSSVVTQITSDSSFQDVFQSVISSKTVDSSTVAMAKKMTSQYMEQRNWSAAITVIKTTLQRTWASFFSGSIHDVTIASAFLQESIELVESLAECYKQQRQMDSVEDVYVRFFRAVLASPNVDKTIFEKAKTLLVAFYDKRGYPDNAISVFQDILVVYRSTYGATHEYTIQTLYTLGSRCRAHPRNHPYWIDYYQQVVTSLNKESDICHNDAVEAIIIVANSYWEDRRYAEAVTVFAVLWNTFVRRPKEYKQFSDASFVQTLYERFFQCLEETRASWQILHKVTKDYRETCNTVFEADSTIIVEATLSLARVTQRSEEHAFEAIALYEQASKSSKSSTTTVTEIKHQLSSLYVRQLKSQSSSSVKSETVDRAITMHEEQYGEASTKYGYAHNSSLTQLHELSSLYFRQQKTEQAVKQLTSAVAAIISKETSSQKLIESAASIAQSFQACQQVQRCTELVQELHRQICAKDTRYASKWSFDVSTYNQSVLAFVASLEYNIRKDLSITFTEILADITAEFVYFEHFRQALKANVHIRNVILAGAPLRAFLLRRQLSESAVFVEDETVNLFVKRDAANLNPLSKASPKLFIVSILEYIGSRKNANLNRAIILASNKQVAALVKAKKFTEAYDIAHFAFLFAKNNAGYDGPQAISHGFKLASLLVGREGEKCPDANLRKKILDLSNQIVRQILDICKNLKINFAQVQLPELSHLVALLGEQQDYVTLEWLLTTLWSTRDAQRSWPSQVLVALGRRLVCARYLAGHPIKAIRLCEDIAYNMRRAHGSRSPATLETYELLAQLYTSTALSYQSKSASEKTGSLATEYFKKAVGIHTEILQYLVQEENDDDSDDDDTVAELLEQHGVSVNGSVDEKMTEQLQLDQPELNKSAMAIRHLHLLKLAFQRLGGWPREYRQYERLNAQLFREFSGEKEWKGAQGVETWSAKGFGQGKAESKDGEFEGVPDWMFVEVAQKPQANGGQQLAKAVEHPAPQNGQLKVAAAVR